MIVTRDTTRSKMVAPCDIRRPEDDDRATRPSHPPLSYPRNRKRQLPLQEQLGESRQTRKGETSKLDERLTPKPSSSRVSSQWKSRVKSQRKSTSIYLDVIAERPTNQIFLRRVEKTLPKSSCTIAILNKSDYAMLCLIHIFSCHKYMLIYNFYK